MSDLPSDTPVGLIQAAIVAETARAEAAAVAGAEAVRGDAGILADVWMARYAERKSCINTLTKLKHDMEKLTQ